MSEQDDWKTIEDWRARTSHEVKLTSADGGPTLDTPAQPWRLELINWGPKCEQRGGPFIGARVNVIEAGARWCRSNDAANHAEHVAANLDMLPEPTRSDDLDDDAVRGRA